MLVSLGFLLVIVAMSAFLAVLADNVGRKLGKKRLSVRWKRLSIRPKHMAMIGTAVTGAGVSLATILVVAAVSKDVREWIVRGQAAIQEAEGLVRNNRDLESQISARESTIRTRDRDIQAKTSEIANKTTEIARSSAEIQKQKDELKRLEGQVSELRAEVPRLRQELEASKRQVDQIDRRLGAARSQLVASQNRLRTVNATLKSTAETMTEAIEQKEELNRQNLELLNEQTNLTRKISSLEGDVQLMETNRDQVMGQLKTTLENLEARQQDLTNAQEELAKYETKLQQAMAVGNLFQDISHSARFSPIIFQIHEEVSRLSVDEPMSRGEAGEALDRLLRQSRLAAIERGARPNNKYSEAGFVERGDAKSGETISVDEIRRQLVDQIVKSKEPLVMVAYSSLNAFKGEAVSLDVVLYPNPVVYRSGQVVAETRVDGRLNEVEIYKQISDLVGTKVKERAQKDRMIPRTGADQSFGSVSSEALLRLVGDIKTTERTVRLLAMAASETRAGDALKLSFQIR